MGGRRHKRASMLRLPKASSHSQRAEDQEARQVRFGPRRDWLENDRLASSGYTWSTSNAPHVYTRTDDTPELQAGGTTTPEPGGGAHRKRPHSCVGGTDVPCEWSPPDEQAPRFFLEKIASRLKRRALFTNLFSQQTHVRWKSPTRSQRNTPHQLRLRTGMRSLCFTCLAAS